MQLIEAALAFAITMLVLSLIVSSFVELIHRAFSMREAGLKHMLGQLFDQVLQKYLKPEDVSRLVEALPEAAQADARKRIELARQSFVERMSANRAPMGATSRVGTAPEAATQIEDGSNPLSKLWKAVSNFISRLWKGSSLWNGRDLSAMTPSEFMERLGSIDVGKAVADANKVANEAFKDTANAAADMADAVLKDVAQKFEAFGKESSVYFEGPARLLSVAVAIGLAFAAHVDAVDLFKTYLRDPNARAKVIEQSEAVTAQHKAAEAAAKALAELAPQASQMTAEEIGRQVEA